MELRRKFHPMAENDAQLLRKIKIAQPDPTERAGCKFRKHIDIASLWIEILPQDRPKERKGEDAPFSTKAGNPFTIDHDGQVCSRHRRRDYSRAKNGQPNSAADASTPAPPGSHPSSFRFSLHRHEVGDAVRFYAEPFGISRGRVENGAGLEKLLLALRGGFSQSTRPATRIG